MADLAKGERIFVSKGSAVLPDGRSQRLDGALPVLPRLEWSTNTWKTRTGISTLPVLQFIITSCTAPRSNKLHILLVLLCAYSQNQVFYFIRPTAANLAAYERWSGTELQYQSWLGDMVDEVFKVKLKQGNTMIIPSGWIHAVVRSSFQTFH